jgi:pyruvate kinase
MAYLVWRCDGTLVSEEAPSSNAFDHPERTSLHPMRRTKLVASLGPATDDEEVLRGIIRAGVDVARVNLSHGSVEEGMVRYHAVRKIAAEEGRHVGVLADLPGPKVRVAKFEKEYVFENGDQVRIVVGNKSSTREVIEVDYADVVSSFVVGDRIVIGDGRIVMQVRSAEPDKLVAEVVHAGKITGQPGVHVPADKLTMSTPTAHDLKLLDAFVEVGVDMVAISFVKSAHDMRRVGTEPHPRGPLLVAKIETRSAVENLEGIIEASGAIMVARGDLGNELPIEDLPITQKQIIERCIAGGKPVITATQMLESMITAPAPTRAEASDVANAVWDGSSAVMLSGETAVGVDPINVVRTMGRIARKADEVFDHEAWARNVTSLRMTESGSGREVTDAMTVATWRAVRELDVAAILCISGSGFTVRQMARFRPEAMILGITTNPKTLNQLTMSWGTTPVFLPNSGSREEMMTEAVKMAAAEGLVRSGDQVALLGGDGVGAKVTNNLRIVVVP